MSKNTLKTLFDLSLMPIEKVFDICNEMGSAANKSDKMEIDKCLAEVAKGKDPFRLM